MLNRWNWTQPRDTQSEMSRANNFSLSPEHESNDSLWIVYKVHGSLNYCGVGPQRHCVDSRLPVWCPNSAIDFDSNLRINMKIEREKNYTAREKKTATDSKKESVDTTKEKVLLTELRFFDSDAAEETKTPLRSNNSGYNRKLRFFPFGYWWARGNWKKMNRRNILIFGRVQGKRAMVERRGRENRRRKEARRRAAKLAHSSWVV